MKEIQLQSMDTILIEISETDIKEFDDDYRYYYHLVSKFLEKYQHEKNKQIKIVRKTPHQLCLSWTSAPVVCELLKNGNHLNFTECFVTECFCEDLITELQRNEAKSITGTLVIAPAPANGRQSGRAEALEADRMKLNWVLTK